VIYEEYQAPDEPAEYYQSLFDNLITKAKSWRDNSQQLHTVLIHEDDLSSHFTSNWEVGDNRYVEELLSWRGDDEDELTNPTVIESESSGKKSYIVDTGDLYIGRKSDEFFFHRIGRCLGYLFDVETETGEILRIAYHMPGIMVNKELGIDKLLETITHEGRITHLTLFFNSTRQTKPLDSIVKSKLSENTIFTGIDMNALDESSSHDIFVTGDKAHQFFNKGHWDNSPPERNETIERHHSGDWDL